ncbi:hypothetical protein CJ305_12975 [Leeuwenhoekiella nanhaiensis]|uniref:Uncharacterized protein n=1 Tax=Leeuwenhoekiella nanhaiensis TaxID=1655491 RepID=A0A2G1VPN6_9FLAO|nr:hypothetical protein CJ305_12975 [Leeuwenhoekiella nanhaiensis]
MFLKNKSKPLAPQRGDNFTLKKLHRSTEIKELPFEGRLEGCKSLKTKKISAEVCAECVEVRNQHYKISAEARAECGEVRNQHYKISAFAEMKKKYYL